jgi:hypothetical protein
MIELSTIRDLVAIFGVIAGFSYYVLTVRNSRKSHELQIFMTILDGLNSEDKQKAWAELLNSEVKDYDDFLQKYDSTINPEHYGKRASVWSYYNSIGYLLMSGRISIDIVYDLLGLPAVLQWNKWGGIILEIREKQALPQYFKGFEYLVDELRKYQKRNSETVSNR